MSQKVIIDNGSYEIKYGDITQKSPDHVPNCVIRTSDKRILLGQDLNPDHNVIGDYSGIQFSRPIEHSQLTQWSVETQIWDNSFVDKHLSDDWLQDADLIFCESPFTISKFQNMTDEVLFEEYGVENLFRCSAGFLTPWITFNGESSSKDGGKYSDFQLVIDSGFDSTWVIPMIYGLPYWDAVRKMPIGGRFLNGYLREMISFRHYNVTEETVLVNKIKEDTCYVTQDYEKSLKYVEKLRQNPSLKDERDISINYALPDFKTSNIGYTMTNSQLSRLQKAEEVQSLKLYDERFAIPELLFHPELSGVRKAGLITTIKDSLANVPELIRPLLVSNIVIMGGTSNFRGFKDRLIHDLKREVPIDDEVIVHDFHNIKNRSEIGWFAGKKFYSNGGFEQVAVSKSEYQELGAEYTQNKFGYKV